MPVDRISNALLLPQDNWERHRERHDPGYHGAHMEWVRPTGKLSHIQYYSVDGPCPTICTDGVNVFDPRDGAKCYRKLHSTELMAIQGFHPGYKFPFQLSEAERVRIIGLSMDGHCVRALGTALAEYIHGVNTPAPLITCSSAS